MVFQVVASMSQGFIKDQSNFFLKFLQIRGE